MDFDKVTWQDCIELFEKKDKAVVLNDGHVVDFEEYGYGADRKQNGR
ncbi:MAG: hypothetical protein HDR01_05845 [Lachnospiraceae bacterium]|nr:hypothetical protein [Lachnospiraceae bacterium]